MIDIAASVISLAMMLWAALDIKFNNEISKLLAFVFFAIVLYMASRLSFIGWAGMPS